MGRNGPEHRPGSENPRPLPWSGRRAGRKSLTLIPSPFPLPQRFPSPRPLPAPVFLLSRFGGWELCVTLAMVTPPTSREGGAKGGPRGPDEGVTGGGVGEELKPTQAGKLRHDVMEEILIYRRLDAISVFRGWKSAAGTNDARHECNVATDGQVLKCKHHTLAMGRQALKRTNWKLEW
ncbi:hypothetical protein QTO34_011416 [Cnephaeus nilssonii]|uniref:Uncharacterized protein n=1 Tax=Cnephaeus nilssonii TaxID=3371016 RepID=A0AA40LDC1_CNENI|nr:hypothetical protein QTO34_011416 [Eptesicus nilssonii]